MDSSLLALSLLGTENVNRQSIAGWRRLVGPFEDPREANLSELNKYRQMTPFFVKAGPKPSLRIETLAGLNVCYEFMKSC